MADSPVAAEILLAEANQIEALAEELASATARLTDVWVGPSQERLQEESLGQVEQLRAVARQLRVEATTIGSGGSG